MVAAGGGGVGGQGVDHGAEPVHGDRRGFAGAVALLGALAAVGAQGQPGRGGSGFGELGVGVGGQDAGQRAVDGGGGVLLRGEMSDVVGQGRGAGGQQRAAGGLAPGGVEGEVAGVGEPGVGGQALLNQARGPALQQILADSHRRARARPVGGLRKAGVLTHWI